MITISSTPNGLKLTRDGASYTATGPAVLGCLITRLTRPATAPASALPVLPAPARRPGTPRVVSAPAGRSLGQRIADARAKLVQCGAM